MDVTCINRERVFLDFETHPIDKASGKPPEPVGLAYKFRNAPAVYLAFGHDEGNNATKEDAYALLKKVYDSNYNLCFHNGVFDLNVAKHHFGLPIPDADRIDDTMILAFIVNPEFPQFGLKELCQSLLKMKPEERDELKEYIKEKYPKTAPSKLMQHIHAVPGDLVASYSCGDVERTEKLLEYLLSCLDKDYTPSRKKVKQPWFLEEKLIAAYDREKRASLMLGDMRYTGIRVDVEALRRDIAKSQLILQSIEDYFFNLLGKKINFNSGRQVLSSFSEIGILDASKLEKTKKGNLSASADSLAIALTNKEVASVYKYQMSLSKMLKTYMQNWLAVAEKNDGLIYSDWLSIGARTGRITSSPNFQNIPNTYSINDLFNINGERPELPNYPLSAEPLSPTIRSYVIPFKTNHKLISVDYSQQELRLLAHYENKSLLNLYKGNPNADLHNYVAEVMSKNFKKIDKPTAKALNFTIIYGGGKNMVAKKLGLSVDDAIKLMQKHQEIFPTIYTVKNTLEKRVLSGLPFFTLGGRRYFAKIDDFTGEPKLNILLNTLIQGGSADMSKSAMLEFYRLKHPETIVLLSTHDELTISAPEEIAEAERDKLMKVMESQTCRTPLVTAAHIADNLAGCK